MQRHDPSRLLFELWGHLNLCLHGEEKITFNNVEPGNGFCAWRRIVVPIGPMSEAQLHRIHKAGMTASFWQAFPDLSNAEIIQTLENYADNYNRPDTAYGYGIPDFYASSKALNTAIIEINNSIHFYRVPVAAGQAPFFVFKNKVEKPLKLNLETAQGTQLWTNTAATANEAYQKLHIVRIPIWNDLSAGVYFLNIRMDGRDKKICLLK